MKSIVGFVCFLIFFGSAGMARATPILIESSGNLMGATGVDVNGSLFDVSFVNGSCNSLYGGCNEVTDFVFTSQTMADAAGAALLSQVLNGAADTTIELVNGIEGTSGSVIGTFYWDLVGNIFKQSSIRNHIDEIYDQVQTTWSFGAASVDTTTNNTYSRRCRRYSHPSPIPRIIKNTA